MPAPTSLSHHPALLELASQAAAALRRGQLQLRDLLGLSEAELAALAALAESCRRDGQLEEAASILSILLTCAPTDAGPWQAMGDLQRGRGEHRLAVSCYETAAMLGARDPQATRREAESLRQIGHPELAGELLGLQAAMAAEEGGDSCSSTAQP